MNNVSKKQKCCATCNSWMGGRDAKDASDPKRAYFRAEKSGLCNNSASSFSGKQVEHSKLCNRWSKWIMIS